MALLSRSTQSLAVHISGCFKQIASHRSVTTFLYFSLLITATCRNKFMVHVPCQSKKYSNITFSFKQTCWNFMLLVLTATSTDRITTGNATFCHLWPTSDKSPSHYLLNYESTTDHHMALHCFCTSILGRMYGRCYTSSYMTEVGLATTNRKSNCLQSSVLSNISQSSIHFGTHLKATHCADPLPMVHNYPWICDAIQMSWLRTVFVHHSLPKASAALLLFTHH